jgi:hypothetical protein
MNQVNQVGIENKDMNALVDAGLLTFLGHCESRVASLLGKGFYTIGPCGEEVMGVLGAVLNKDDPMALHYRHVAASVRSISLCLTSKPSPNQTHTDRTTNHSFRSICRGHSTRPRKSVHGLVVGSGNRRCTLLHRRYST